MALYRGGVAVDDPDAWLDSLDEDVVDYWDAFYRLEPFGGEYQRHAAQMEVLESIFTVLQNQHVPANRPDLRYVPRKRRDFMPADYAGEQRKPRAKKTIGSQLNEYAETIKAAGQ